MSAFIAHAQEHASGWHLDQAGAALAATRRLAAEVPAVRPAAQGLLDAGVLRLFLAAAQGGAAETSTTQAAAQLLRWVHAWVHEPLSGGASLAV